MGVAVIRWVGWWMRLSCCVGLVPAPGIGGVGRDESKLGLMSSGIIKVTSYKSGQSGLQMASSDSAVVVLKNSTHYIPQNTSAGGRVQLRNSCWKNVENGKHRKEKHTASCP